MTIHELIKLMAAEDISVQKHVDNADLVGLIVMTAIHEWKFHIGQTNIVFRPNTKPYSPENGAQIELQTWGNQYGAEFAMSYFEAAQTLAVCYGAGEAVRV